MWHHDSRFKTVEIKSGNSKGNGHINVNFWLFIIWYKFKTKLTICLISNLQNCHMSFAERSVWSNFLKRSTQYLMTLYVGYIILELISTGNRVVRLKIYKGWFASAQEWSIFHLTFVKMVWGKYVDFSNLQKFVVIFVRFLCTSASSNPFFLYHHIYGQKCNTSTQ